MKGLRVLKVSRKSKIYTVSPDGRRENIRLNKDDIINIKTLRVKKK